MSISNKNNITKYSDVNRKLTKLEVDTNFQELKNVVDDIDVLTDQVALKANQTDLDNINAVSIEMIDNIDNTSDADKPVSVAQQAALDLKTNISDLASTDSDKGAAMVGFKQQGAGSVERTLQDKAREWVSVKDFGAIGDGQSHPLSERFSDMAAAQAVYPHATALTDEIDWAAIQAAINAASVKGGVVFFDALVYIVSKTLLISNKAVFLKGIVGKTTITANFGNSDVIKFYNSSGFIGGGCYGIIIGCSVLPTSGFAINFDNVGECTAEEVRWKHTYNGIGFNGNNRNCAAKYCGGSDVVNNEVEINGGGNQSIVYLATYYNSISTSQASFYIRETVRCDLDFCTSSLHKHGIIIRPDAGKIVQNVFVNFPDIDAGTGTGITIDSLNENTVIRNIKIHNGIVGANSEYGIHLKQGSGQIGEVYLSNILIRDNKKNGILVEAGQVHLYNCTIARNGIDTGDSGIRVASTAETIIVNSGSIGRALGGPNTAVRPMSYENYQLYGVIFDTGFSGYSYFSDVDLAGNITAPILNNSNAQVQFTRCKGLPDLNTDFDIVYNSSSEKSLKVTNLSTGSSAIAQFRVSNGVNSAWYGMAGPNYGGYGQIKANGMAFYTNSSAGIGFSADNANSNITFGAGAGAPARLTISNKGNISATAGTVGMTDGFFYIPAASGEPTGVPTSIIGSVPMFFDKTANALYVYNGSAWKKVFMN